MPPSALELIQPLIGQTLLTLADHEPNEVLEVRGAKVMVGTKKSPEGAPVPLKMIQRGLDILFSDGEVRIEPATFDDIRRSSFVGAALGTLPEVTWTKRPVWVQLTSAPAPARRGASGSGGTTYPSPSTAAAIDEAGVAFALDAVRGRFPSCEVEEMAHTNPGFDILVRENGLETAYVEVKSTASPSPAFFMSETERQFA